MVMQPSHQPQPQCLVELAEVLGWYLARQEIREVAKLREPLPNLPSLQPSEGDSDAG